MVCKNFYPAAKKNQRQQDILSEGPVAQLAERTLRMREARGSNPLRSTANRVSEESETSELARYRP